MVEEVEELKTEAQLGTLPARDFRILHDREVHIDVARSAVAIAALRKGHARAAAGTALTWQGSRVESGLTASLQEQCAGIGRRCPIRVEQHLRCLLYTSDAADE